MPQNAQALEEVAPLDARWTVRVLVEALGALRWRYAESCLERARERARSAEELESARSAVSRSKNNERSYCEEIGRNVREIERLKTELKAARRELDARTVNLEEV